MADRTCVVDDCGREVRCAGLCNGHYKRWNATGDVRAEIPLQKKRRGRTETCSADDCTEVYMAKGLCKRHYMEDRAERFGREPCTVDGCQRPRGSTGTYCAPHYQRSREYGDPLAGPPMRKQRASGPRGTGNTSEYHQNHRAVRKARGAAWQYDCARCDSKAATWAQKHGTPGADPDDYMPLCWPCHAVYDRFADRLPDNRGSRRTPEQRENIRQGILRSHAEKPEFRERQRQAALRREAAKRARLG